MLCFVLNVGKPAKCASIFDIVFEKTGMKKHLIKLGLLSLLMTFISNGLLSQNMQYSRKYRVIAYKNGNSSITSMSNETEVTPTMSIYIPNSFTPNGDGLNDTFGISGEAIKDFSIQIFNRWGDLIFETKNASHNWDGTFNGNRVSEGVYVYKVAASNITGRKTQKEGTVTVVL